VQDVHNLPIREVFIFPEQNNFAKIDWQLLNRRTHLLGLQFAYVMVVRVFGWLDDVVGSVIPAPGNHSQQDELQDFDRSSADLPGQGC
jgi:hypothetical protein